ncbi:MAG: hypothetical protein K5639_00740, partial [Eubacterium sp.]|nr:hypothetical protein [Eubacterium sp.]
MKALKVFSNDTTKVTVDKVILTSKKVGFRLKMKSVGDALVTFQLSLKKKQAGKKVYKGYRIVSSLKKLSKKELEKIDTNIKKVNTLTALLEKHDNFRSRGGFYGPDGAYLSGFDIYNTKEDVFFLSHLSGDNDDYVDKALYFKEDGDTGYSFEDYKTNGKSGSLQGYVIDVAHTFGQIRVGPYDEKDDTLAYDKVVGYFDGYDYYRSYECMNNGYWERVDEIIDGKTYEVVEAEIYYKDDNNKIYKHGEYVYETDVDMCVEHKSLKYEYERETPKMITATIVMDPNTPESTSKEYKFPSGSEIMLSGKVEGYTAYKDPEGKTPAVGEITDEPQIFYDDFTAYFIKD